VIDGATSTVAATVAVGAKPAAVAVNMLTNVVYVANSDPVDPNISPNGSVTVIAETTVPTSPLVTSITPLPGNATASTTPTFSMTATGAPGFPVRKVYYQVDTDQGAWLTATPAGGSSFSGTTPTLTPGNHTLYAFATDGNDATTINAGPQSSPLTGAITTYLFAVTVVPPVTFTVTPANTAHGSINPTTQQIVNPNDSIDFTVTPDNGYQIVTVTGCGGTMINPTTYRTGPVTADCTVTPTFGTLMLPVRIGSSYYQTLLEAYAVAPSGSVIQAMATSFPGGLNLNRTGIAVTLQGGYDDTYATQSGTTVVVGNVTIGMGSLVADRLTIQ
jgi:hypothetical protein